MTCRILVLAAAALVLGCTSGETVQSSACGGNDADLFYGTDKKRVKYTPSGRYVVVPAGTELMALDPDARRSLAVQDFEIARQYGFQLLVPSPNATPEEFRVTVRDLCGRTEVFDAYRSGTDDIVFVNEVIIRFKDQVDSRSILDKVNVTFDDCKSNSLVSNRYVCNLPVRAPGRIVSLVNDLSANPGVEYAIPNFIIIAPKAIDRYQPPKKKRPEPQRADAASAMVAAPFAFGPNDEFYTSGDQQFEYDLIKALDAWKIVTGGCHVKIAVLDFAVELQHPDLEHKIDGSFDAIMGKEIDKNTKPDDAHGTLVAGVAAAHTNNNQLGVAGTMWGGKIISIRIFEGSSNAYATAYSKIVDGITQAVELGARVMVNSWGYKPTEQMITDEDFNAVVDSVIEGGAVMVFAVGNGSGDVEWPANLSASRPVVAVGATDFQGQLLSISKGHNGDPEVSLVAPGEWIETTDISGPGGHDSDPSPGGDYYMSFGDTSAAAPFVAGTVGLLMSWHPGATPHEIKTWLEDGSKPPINIANGPWGKGLLDISASLDQAGTGGVDIEPVLLPAAPLSHGEVASVRVRVTRHGEPLSGVMVSFQPGNAALAAVEPSNRRVATDCDGTASAMVTGLSQTAEPAVTDLLVQIGRGPGDVLVAKNIEFNVVGPPD